MINTEQQAPDGLKTYVFAMYYKQKVYHHNAWIDDKGDILTIDKLEYAGSFRNDCCLLLRALSSITDEEAIEVAKILIGEPFNRYRQIVVTRNNAVTGWPYITVHHKNVRYRLQIDCTLVNFNIIDMEEDITSQTDMKPYACIDFLRGVGIALPIFYKGTLYSVSDLEAMGIYKLTE